MPSSPGRPASAGSLVGSATDGVDRENGGLPRPSSRHERRASIRKPASKHHFTDAARAAAAEAKRLKKETAMPKDTPEVLVVRRVPTGLVFGWEIRRFGAVVLQKGDVEYSTMHEARTAGESALSGFRIVA